MLKCFLCGSDVVTGVHGFTWCSNKNCVLSDAGIDRHHWEAIYERFVGDDNEKLHWFNVAFAFLDGEQPAIQNKYLGRPKKSMPKESLENMIVSSVGNRKYAIIDVSYLGHMTHKEFDDR